MNEYFILIQNVFKEPLKWGDCSHLNNLGTFDIWVKIKLTMAWPQPPHLTSSPPPTPSFQTILSLNVFFSVSTFLLYFVFLVLQSF